MTGETLNNLIERHRLERGLTLEDVSVSTGLNLDSYWDVERHSDKIYSNVSLGVVRRILQVLGINLYAIIESHCGKSGNDYDPVMYWGLGRHEIIAARRAELGFSEEEFGDILGFEIVAIREIERSPDGIDNYHMDFLNELAVSLKLDATFLAMG